MLCGWWKVNAAYRRVDDFYSPVGRLPVHWDQLRAQCSVMSMGNLLPTDHLIRFWKAMVKVKQRHPSHRWGIDVYLLVSFIIIRELE